VEGDALWRPEKIADAKTAIPISCSVAAILPASERDRRLQTQRPPLPEFGGGVGGDCSRVQ
jgi:hypothetical protein